MVNIVVNRGKVVELKELPPKSIALDGYVQGPEIDTRAKRFSFDHHARCERLVTKATCEQVLDALLLGFDPEGYTVYVNDVDADTVLAVYLLQHPRYAFYAGVRRLVSAVGAIDAHGPSYPVFAADGEIADAFFHGVMAPEKDARRDGSYATCDLAELLERCLYRCKEFDSYRGRLEKKEPQYRTVLTHARYDVVVVESNDFVFQALYERGHNRVIAYNVQKDGSYAYTIGAKSSFVENFPVGPANVPGTILDALAQVEPGWGGGSTIGGAPRNADGSRSWLTPERVLEIVVAVIDAANAA